MSNTKKHMIYALYMYLAIAAMLAVYWILLPVFNFLELLGAGVSIWLALGLAGQLMSNALERSSQAKATAS